MAETTPTTATRPRVSAGRRIWTALGAYPRLTFGAVLLLVLIVLALAAPVFASYGPLDQHLDAVLKPPGGGFVFGTDQLGRDVLSRSLYGGRLVLAVAVVSVLIACVIGVLLGLLSGYKGRWADAVIMRVMDGVIVFPELVLALTITYALGPSFWTVATAIAVVNVPKFARVVRGQVLSLREREFIASAKVSGASTLRVLLRHLLPNVLEVTVVQSALTGGMAIFTAASLSFLGLGLPAPAPDWGGMLRDGYPYLGNVPLMSLIPGCFIFIAMLSFNLIGDGLRDLFDPRVVRRMRIRPSRTVVGAEATAPSVVRTDRTPDSDPAEATARPALAMPIANQSGGASDES
jgi:ABC-type dipeptide/oligopeptide/nickel transport system permease subunit